MMLYNHFYAVFKYVLYDKNKMMMMMMIMIMMMGEIDAEFEKKIKKKIMTGRKRAMKNPFYFSTV